MYLAKTRAVAFSEEKSAKKHKRYYIPSRYTLREKTDRNISSYIKKEDLVWKE